MLKVFDLRELALLALSPSTEMITKLFVTSIDVAYHMNLVVYINPPCTSAFPWMVVSYMFNILWNVVTDFIKNICIYDHMVSG